MTDIELWILLMLGFISAISIGHLILFVVYIKKLLELFTEILDGTKKRYN